MDELKRCPFCEYEAVLETMQVRKGWEADIHCNGCLASIHTITHDTEQEAIDAAKRDWNNRSDGWISDRNPVESDADENGNVPVILPNGMMLFYKWSYVRVECGDSWIPYQKPLPEPPKGE